MSILLITIIPVAIASIFGSVMASVHHNGSCGGSTNKTQNTPQIVILDPAKGVEGLTEY